jgi:hypothetical protein
MRSTRIAWPIVIIFSSLVALFAMFVLPDGLAKPWLIMWFLCICPGMAFVHFLNVKEIIVKLTLAVALSFSYDGLIAGVYLYAHSWSPPAIMLTLTMSSIILVVIELTNAHVTLYQRVSLIRRLYALLTHPLIIGTDPITPQLAGTGFDLHQDVIEKPTIRLIKEEDSISSWLSKTETAEIEETPTIQMNHIKTVPEAQFYGGDQPTIQLSKVQIQSTRKRSHTKNTEIGKAPNVEEQDTVQITNDIKRQPTHQLTNVSEAEQAEAKEDETIPLSRESIRSALQSNDSSNLDDRAADQSKKRQPGKIHMSK